ncbi:MAG: hypothetical protein IT308_13265 [Anaerolineaceae bacterium]|nr:hypothetical protein [Anaerolineaceae bacterium]
MSRFLSSLLDALSSFLAPRKGLLPTLGVILVIINFLLQVFSAGWLASTNLFLHLGVILSILGIMLAWAL